MKPARYVEPEYEMLYDWDAENRQLEIDCGYDFLKSLRRQEIEANEHYQNLLASDVSTLGK